MNKLIKVDTKLGEGAEAQAGQTVVVHYTGWLYDESAPDNKGSKFDSSLDRNEPFDFPLGAGRVISGWDEGVQGMKEGGVRTLLIPPEMGYGASGAGDDIPPNATLVFEVKLLNVIRTEIVDTRLGDGAQAHPGQQDGPTRADGGRFGRRGNAAQNGAEHSHDQRQRRAKAERHIPEGERRSTFDDLRRRAGGGPEDRHEGNPQQVQRHQDKAGDQRPGKEIAHRDHR